MSSNNNTKHLQYHSGFNNQHASEALKGALPDFQNTPQKCPFGLYAEQLQGSSFTAPREHNFRSWLYRIRPTASYPEFKPLKKSSSKIQCSFPTNEYTSPRRYRWMPVDIPNEKTDFIDGIFTIAGAGNAAMKSGFATHLYAISDDMYNSTDKKRVMINADGDFLLVPEHGALYIKTEFGDLEVHPKEIAVIPRGVRFAINPLNGTARGYICELFQGHFELPGLGPIGANGLANPRDFLYPTARYEESDDKVQVVHKMQAKLFETQTWSPFDVVAWHGNYAPYKYDLTKFCAVNSVTFDHIDPSVFTVLTAQSPVAGTAVVDFVIFPPRWGVAENTFRPPYFHRNTMSEYMGLITGNYEAKMATSKKGGFVPGGGSLHNCMSGHGPEIRVFEKESTKKLEPERVGDGSLAFMFESMYHFNVTKFGAQEATLDEDYAEVWSDVKKNFNPNERGV
uniref:homogentisate 1,2-dioxygenase n=1 Tax=Percolomonas cosmopolitus TaxID=63605 RepID=A0A7S1KQG1_9EUKA|eukprot:CAMPEP_0117445206 /NCGR_PEP_ID=MMETSP0759-20121206/5669_1 /TAXON_ID=63605 /ORGANISM="Percolomonas cosmopolitus, Strain WS" /LENGTH=452 /DNA_ID=CAMNT_0005237361 /DNA_START=5 /DNA_END=1363 /DNA_ORIENTATION=-